MQEHNELVQEPILKVGAAKPCFSIIALTAGIWRS